METGDGDRTDHRTREEKEAALNHGEYKYEAVRDDTGVLTCSSRSSFRLFLPFCSSSLAHVLHEP